MPLPLAPVVGLLLGLGLAWLARVELARSEVPLVLARPFLVALGFGLVVFGPVVGYAVALHGDWSYLYLIRFTRIPSAIDLVLVVLAAATVPIGFALGAPWALAKRGSALLKLGAVLVVLLAGGTLLAAKRLAVSASFAQYHGAFGGAPIAQTPLGRGVLLSWLALLAGYGWAARVLIRRVL
ncbi:MAG: hypothetical protein KIT84_14800 [Labilithrix sp.]|nr:hypothetical protein [Labilithrix sp.]MCW5812291.1 hypothetical protein [Labilithrix sp.]